MHTFEQDVQFAYLLYLNDQAFRSDMLRVAEEYVMKLDATDEHYVFCGSASAADVEFVASFVEMAKSYGIELPHRDNSREWRIDAEVRLWRFGYKVPNQDRTQKAYEREKRCVEVLSVINRFEESGLVSKFLALYSSADNDYGVYTAKLSKVEEDIGTLSEASMGERQTVALICYIQDIAYVGITEDDLKTVTSILESLIEIRVTTC